MGKLSLLLALGLMVIAPKESAYSPAQLRDGTPPPIPIKAVGGGEVFAELEVSADGAVLGATAFRTTPPFTDYVLDVVRGWRFFPARDVAEPAAGRGPAPISRIPVASRVLVAAIFRPPALWGPTLGELPKDLGMASESVPSPLVTIPPPYPPTAMGSGVVLLEAHVSASGLVDDVGVLGSSPAFDAAALNTVQQWRFRPAVRDGVPVAAVIYVVFGFRAPVGISQSAPRIAPAFIGAD